jgi:hypothetical protein
MELNTGLFPAITARNIISEQVSGPPLSEATQRGKPDGWLGPDEATYRWLAVACGAR